MSFDDNGLMTPGVYTGPITECGFYETDSGKPYVEVQIAIEDTHRTARIYTTPAALRTGWPERKLKALGFNFDFRNPKMSAAEATLECTHRVWEGEDRENWDVYVEGFQKTEASKDSVSELNAMFKKQRDEGPKRDARGEAWEAVEEANPDMSDADKAALFAKYAKEIAGDKIEADMTEAEWDEVKGLAETPF